MKIPHHSGLHQCPTLPMVLLHQVCMLPLQPPIRQNTRLQDTYTSCHQTNTWYQQPPLIPLLPTCLLPQTECILSLRIQRTTWLLDWYLRTLWRWINLWGNHCRYTADNSLFHPPPRPQAFYAKPSCQFSTRGDNCWQAHWNCQRSMGWQQR